MPDINGALCLQNASYLFLTSSELTYLQLKV